MGCETCRWRRLPVRPVLPRVALDCFVCPEVAFDDLGKPLARESLGLQTPRRKEDALRRKSRPLTKCVLEWATATINIWLLAKLCVCVMDVPCHYGVIFLKQTVPQRSYLTRWLPFIHAPHACCLVYALHCCQLVSEVFFMVFSMRVPCSSLWRVVLPHCRLNLSIRRD